ncbi:MAG: arsenate reductase (glutaredoxin) [Pseudomonadota bacterium]|nr:arsenate reductase (glutaredoxin) [Pseudomonadota bacterium]MDO7711738.1 arsenate reductase (glutaredoxin) [Pseudomonadota bacterium]
MSELFIYHNPRCSKSRQTLALLEEQGVKPEVIEYLKTPPSVASLRAIIGQLGISARQLLRKGEAEYKDLNLADESLSEQQLIQAMCEYPKLMERPIVTYNGKAKIGRPPESVLEIL